MAANPAQITDEQIRHLAWLRSTFAAVEAEYQRVERETLREEVQQRTGALYSPSTLLRCETAAFRPLALSV